MDKHKMEGYFRVGEWEQETHKVAKRMVNSHHKVLYLNHPIVH